MKIVMVVTRKQILRAAQFTGHNISKRKCRGMLRDRKNLHLHS